CRLERIAPRSALVLAAMRSPFSLAARSALAGSCAAVVVPSCSVFFMPALLDPSLVRRSAERNGKPALASAEVGPAERHDCRNSSERTEGGCVALALESGL